VITVVLSLSARLALAALSSSPTERLVCLIGSVRGSEVIVDSVVPNDDPNATSSLAVAREPCPPGAVGRAHSHPGGERCWYTFPGTIVPTADLVSFRRSGHDVDGIVCGALLVWVTRDGAQGVTSLQGP